MNRIILFLAIAGLLTIGSAQRDLVSPETAANDEAGMVFVPNQNTGAPQLAGSMLDMIYECNRATGSIIAIGGIDHVRVYGFDFISDDEYALRGPRAFSTATQRAETRAIGSATEFIIGISSYTTRSLADTEASSTAATSTGAPTERERLSSLSVSTQSVMKRVYETSSTGFLRGGHTSGTKFVSLGGEFGYCVVVRYDVPFDQSGDAGAVRPAATQPAGPPAREAGDDGYAPLPPGTAGDF